MLLFKFLRLLMLSERGEDEPNPAQPSDPAPADPEGEPSEPAAEPSSQPGEPGQPQEPAEPEPKPLTQEQYDQLNTQYESLKGKTTATERNLSATRKALEGMGLRWVQDAQGQVQLVSATQEGKGNSRFSDEQKNKFFSYFPDAKAGEEFLSLMNLWAEDFFEPRISKYDQKITQRQQFQQAQSTSNKRMMQMFPSLDSSNKQSFNKVFYDKATEIWGQSYRHLPNGELIAAHEAAIEMGISPSSVAVAQKAGYQRGQQARKIIGTPQGGRTPAGTGFRKLSFEEYTKLNPDQREEYDRKETEARSLV